MCETSSPSSSSYHHLALLPLPLQPLGIVTGALHTHAHDRKILASHINPLKSRAIGFRWLSLNTFSHTRAHSSQQEQQQQQPKFHFSSFNFGLYVLYIFFPLARFRYAIVCVRTMYASLAPAQFHSFDAECYCLFMYHQIHTKERFIRIERKSSIGCCPRGFKSDGSKIGCQNQKRM